MRSGTWSLPSPEAKKRRCRSESTARPTKVRRPRSNLADSGSCICGIGSALQLVMRLRPLLVLAIPGLALLVACQPDDGDPDDTSPPDIRFQVGGQTVTGGVALNSLPPDGITVVASDSGGMHSLDVTNIAVFDCLATGRREVHSAQLIDIPATTYSDQTHTYHGPSGEFWPDGNHDGINDPAEHALRFDELFQSVDVEYLDPSTASTTAPAPWPTALPACPRCAMSSSRPSPPTTGARSWSDATEVYAELLVFTPEP